MANQRTSSGKDTSDSRIMTASENLARVLGIAFILIGLVLIVSLIGSFVVSKLPYRADPNLPIPTLEEITEYTNEDSIDIKGTVLPGESVVLYQDGDRLNQTEETDDEGNFTFSDVTLEDEGKTKFEAVVVRGGLFKRRSEFSNDVSTEVDWTPPSTSIALEYGEKSNTATTTISGTAEPNTTIIIESETNSYETTADKDGLFTFENVNLAEGENLYSVRIKDRAGNEVVGSEDIAILFEPGDINGPGASTVAGASALPESAGNLDDALEFLAGNRLMLVFALLSLVVFGASSFAVNKKARGQ